MPRRRRVASDQRASIAPKAQARFAPKCIILKIFNNLKISKIKTYFIHLNKLMSRRKNYAATWNNYSGNWCDMVQTWFDEEQNVRYCIFGKEIGENGTPHLQGHIDLVNGKTISCLLYTSPSPRDATLSRMPSSA